MIENMINDMLASEFDAHEIQLLLVNEYDMSETDALDDFNDLCDSEEWEEIKYNYTYPWDNTAGYKGFGFDNTLDYFGKITYDIIGEAHISIHKNAPPEFVRFDDPDEIQKRYKYTTQTNSKEDKHRTVNKYFIVYDE